MAVKMKCFHTGGASSEWPECVCTIASILFQRTVLHANFQCVSGLKEPTQNAPALKGSPSD